MFPLTVLWFVIFIECYICIYFASCHFTDPRIAPLTIPIEVTGSASVKLYYTDSLLQEKPNNIDNVPSCTFSYITTPHEITPVQQPLEGEITTIKLESIASSLTGTCVQSKVDYWQYELCWGSIFRQFHDNDKYTLGKVSSEIDENKKILTYKNGDYCEVIKDNRQTKIYFVCKVTANNPQIISIAETSTCVYTVTVALKSVCADKSFTVITGESPEVVNLDHETEDWLVEIIQLNDQSITCTAQTLEYRASGGSKLNFKEFKLNIEGANSNSELSLENSYEAEKPGRIPIDSKELVISRGSLKNSDHFQGKLSYLKVIA